MTLPMINYLGTQSEAELGCDNTTDICYYISPWLINAVTAPHYESVDCP